MTYKTWQYVKDDTGQAWVNGVTLETDDTWLN
jgi:hypothetical protein